MNITTCLVCAAALCVCGCAAEPPKDYGQSVRQLQQAQVYDPVTLTNPSTKAVTGGDSDLLNGAIQTMRTEPTERANTSKPMTISIGDTGR
jgi:hypothetical protein